MKNIDITQIVWNSFSSEEKKVYALLSIPVRFDEKLAVWLIETVGAKKSVLNCVLRQYTFVHRYKTQGWYFEDGFREYFLGQAEGIFKDEIQVIHRNLLDYYGKTAEKSDSFEKRAINYLILYHMLQINPEQGLKKILDQLANSRKEYFAPVLKSMVRVCKTPLKKVEGRPVYDYLKEHELFLYSFNAPESLKESEKKLKRLFHNIDKEFEKQLASQMLRLRIAITEKLPGEELSLLKLKKQLDTICEEDVRVISETKDDTWVLSEKRKHIKYEYDFFISYVEEYREWFHDNMENLLLTALGNEMGERPKIYYACHKYPLILQEHKKALSVSRCLIPILLPSYLFNNRDWLHYEYEVMKRRTSRTPRQLIKPVVLTGASYFDPYLKHTYYLDCYDYFFYEVKRSGKYTEFKTKIKKWVKNIVADVQELSPFREERIEANFGTIKQMEVEAVFELPFMG